MFMQPIRVQTANGQVEEALLHIAEVNNKAADLRAVAAHLQDVMQIMVFGSQGNLLNANKAAWEAFHGRSTGAMLFNDLLNIHLVRT